MIDYLQLFGVGVIIDGFKRFQPVLNVSYGKLVTLPFSTPSRWNGGVWCKMGVISPF